MTEQSKLPGQNDLINCVRKYLGLESMEVTEDLLDLCGASIDTKALPLLKKRLHEEEALISLLEARGYVRMREKCEQLIASLFSLIVILEQEEQV
jgi:hypothetical protein